MKRATVPLTSTFWPPIFNVFQVFVLGLILLKSGIGKCKIGRPLADWLFLKPQDSGFDGSPTVFAGGASLARPPIVGFSATDRGTN
jgi:hypothetical protein